MPRQNGFLWQPIHRLRWPLESRNNHIVTHRRNKVLPRISKDKGHDDRLVPSRSARSSPAMLIPRAPNANTPSSWSSAVVECTTMHLVRWLPMLCAKLSTLLAASGYIVRDGLA